MQEVVAKDATADADHVDKSFYSVIFRKWKISVVVAIIARIVIIAEKPYVNANAKYMEETRRMMKWMKRLKKKTMTQTGKKADAYGGRFLF